MIVVEPGTKDKDTICKCIDGFELPKDPFTGKPNLDAEKCVPIKGECYKNPCHPKANCFDNFTDFSFVLFAYFWQLQWRFHEYRQL